MDSDKLNTSERNGSVSSNSVPEGTGVSFRKTKYRWLALMFACFFLIGSYIPYPNS